jgi:secreted trypsin-like serine protease
VNRLRLLLALACAALLVLPATALGIINGTADGSAHPYVAFVGQLAAPRQACTGTLVAPTVVVTAAHCASTPGEPMAVIFGENRRAVPPDQWYFGTFQPDPEFCAGCGKGLMGEVANDLAVILLDRPAPGPYATLPTLRAFEKLGGGNWKRMTLVGYGVQSFTPEGIPVSPSGERMRAEAEARGTRWNEFLKLTTSTHAGMGAACFGDSGGPNLVGDTIMAINSVGEGPCVGNAYSYRLDTREAQKFLGQYVTVPKGGDDRDHGDLDGDNDD